MPSKKFVPWVVKHRAWIERRKEHVVDPPKKLLRRMVMHISEDDDSDIELKFNPAIWSLESIRGPWAGAALNTAMLCDMCVGCWCRNLAISAKSVQEKRKYVFSGYSYSLKAFLLLLLHEVLNQDPTRPSKNPPGLVGPSLNCNAPWNSFKWCAEHFIFETNIFSLQDTTSQCIKFTWNC